MDPKAKAKKKAKKQRIKETQTLKELYIKHFGTPEAILYEPVRKPRVDTSKKPETKIQEMYRHAKYFKELGASLTRVETEHNMLGECVEYEVTIRTTNKDIVEQLVDISQDQY